MNQPLPFLAAHIRAPNPPIRISLVRDQTSDRMEAARHPQHVLAPFPFDRRHA